MFTNDITLEIKDNRNIVRLYDLIICVSTIVLSLSFIFFKLRADFIIMYCYIFYILRIGFYLNNALYKRYKKLLNNDIKSFSTKKSFRLYFTVYSILITMPFFIYIIYMIVNDFEIADLFFFQSILFLSSTMLTASNMSKTIELNDYEGKNA